MSQLPRESNLGNLSFASAIRSFWSSNNFVQAPLLMFKMIFWYPSPLKKVSLIALVLVLKAFWIKSQNCLRVRCKVKLALLEFIIGLWTDLGSHESQTRLSHKVCRHFPSGDVHEPWLPQPKSNRLVINGLQNGMESDPIFHYRLFHYEKDFKVGGIQILWMLQYTRLKCSDLYTRLKCSDLITFPS